MIKMYDKIYKLAIDINNYMRANDYYNYIDSVDDEKEATDEIYNYLVNKDSCTVHYFENEIADNENNTVAKHLLERIKEL